MSEPVSKRNTRVDVRDVLARIEQEGPETLLSRGEAVALIASRTKDQRDTERSARNRVGTRMDRAARAGARTPNPPEDGSCLVRLPDGRIAVNELIRWAVTQYRKNFEDLPYKPRVINAHPSDGLRFQKSARSTYLPGSPERKDQEIMRLRAENQQLMDAAANADELHKRELVARFKGK